MGAEAPSTEVGIVGLDWLIANHAGAVLERFQIKLGENRVTLAASFPRSNNPNRYASLRIEKYTEAPVTVYALDQWKAWNWKGGLAPGSAYEANVPERGTRVLTTSTGPIARWFETYSRMGIVRVSR